jgi:hypothetical protein
MRGSLPLAQTIAPPHGMIIKSKDEAAVGSLQELLALPSLTHRQRDAVGRELRLVRSGAEGEKEAAYHIDFHLKDSKNWAVIHDLRLEHNGRVAQIDHLVIGRFFDIFVIESKNYTTGLKVNEHGEFLIRTKWGWKGIDSPIEQNRRHLIVLNELIQHHKLMPMRLGMPMRPSFRNWILVPPACDITHRHVREGYILKMDMFERRITEGTPNMPLLSDVLSVARVSSTQTIMGFARQLASFHRPALSDYPAKFGIPLSTVAGSSEAAAPAMSAGHCDNCGVEVDAKVMAWCAYRSRIYSRRILCRACQPQPASRRRAADTARGRPAV